MDEQGRKQNKNISRRILSSHAYVHTHIHGMNENAGSVKNMWAFLQD